MDEADWWLFPQAEFEKRVNPNDKGQQALLEEMRAHVKKVHSASSAPIMWHFFVHQPCVRRASS